mgnify:CR=1 FL=1
MSEFNVITRSGKRVPIQFDEISRRNEQLIKDLGLTKTASLKFIFKFFL